MYKEIILDYKYIDNFISKESLDIHLSIYRDNLNKLNKLLGEVNYDYSYSVRDLIANIDIFPLSIRGEVLYYLSSILNHNLFFYSISNNEYLQISGLIKRDIDKYFGSYSNFKREFKDKALNLKGSGYTFLVMDDKGELKIINTSNEDSPYYYGYVPIIGLDLWEHAYFLDYRNDKNTYIDKFFENIDFNKINKYYEVVVTDVKKG